MAETDRKFVNRTIKFLIIIGIIIYIDFVTGMTSNINALIRALASNIFGIKIENIGMYMSLYAAIAVLLSSNADTGKKLWYSIGLIITYIVIFTFLAGFRMIYTYSFLSLITTLIAFITMTFPILLWIILDDERPENNKKVIRQKTNSKPHRTNKSV